MTDAAQTAGGETLRALLERRAVDDPGGIALRRKARGIWHDTTWAQLIDVVDGTAAGLAAVGVRPGDVVAIMSEPCPSWLAAVIALESLGASILGVHEGTSDEDLVRLVSAGAPSALIAARPHHVSRFVDLPGVPPIGHRIVIEGQGLELEDPDLLSMEAVWDRARERGAARSLEPRSAPLVLAPTSGAGGAPRLIRLTSSQLISSARCLAEQLAADGTILGPRDRVVAEIPAADVTAPVLLVALPLLCGFVPHFAEAPDAVATAIREVRPTVSFGGGHHWARWASQILVDVDTGTRLKRGVFRLAMLMLGRSSGGERSHRSLIDRTLGYIARWLVVLPLLDQLGLTRVRVAPVRGPLHESTVRQWRTWGVPIREVYSIAEVPLVAMAPLGRHGTLLPLPGVLLRAAPSGELEVMDASPGGFVRDGGAAGTGWIRTGDLAEVDEDGSFRIRGRIGDVVVIDGRTVALAEIEAVLSSSRYVRTAVVVPRARGVSVLVEVDPVVVGQWAAANGIVYTSFESLISDARVTELVRSEVDAVRPRLRALGVSAVAGIAVIPKQLDPRAGDEISPRRTVRRAALTAKFGHLLEAHPGPPPPGELTEATR